MDLQQLAKLGPFNEKACGVPYRVLVDNEEIVGDISTVLPPTDKNRFWTIVVQESGDEEKVIVVSEGCSVWIELLPAVEEEPETEEEDD